MRSEAQLDSVIFQLTPTRTRCDLVIIGDGKTEKIASGLLKPFLAHLKTAEDQIAKGGYSITLEVDPHANALWFTKGIVERFVRFVSTPEVLERVKTIESEILQIEEAISIQGNENLGLSTVEDHQTRRSECIEGNKSTSDADNEKAIVLYKPGSHPNPPDSNGCTKQEESSKVQLLRVLETRKIMLQKEQAMAFARAQAAGFDMDHMAHLITFSERFGASRLREACLRYMDLWNEKHETGQWLEVEAAEVMSQSEFYALNASGIILADTRNKKEFGEVWPVSDSGTESIGKVDGTNGAELNTHLMNPDLTKDKMHASDSQVPLGPHQYFQGHFQHPAFPHWPMHPPPGAPVFQPYPMPYYQSYPGSGPYYQPPYPPVDDPRVKNPKSMGLKRHSMDSKDGNAESETSEKAVSSRGSQDVADENISDIDKETSRGRGSHRRHGHSGRDKSGKVVTRKTKYIASKKHESSGSESQSASDSDSEEESEDSHSDSQKRKHKYHKSLKKKEGHKKSREIKITYGEDEVVKGREDTGNWNAFQSFLLRAEENTSNVSGDIFASETAPPIKIREKNKSEADPILFPNHNYDDVHGPRMMEFDSGNGQQIRIKQVASNDVLLASSGGGGLRDSQLDSQFTEVEGGGVVYRRPRATGDDFMIYGREMQMDNKRSSDPLAENEYQRPDNLDKGSSQNITDESFIVPFRSGSHDQLLADRRTAIEMDSEFPYTLQGTEDSSNKVNAQLCYEPDDLTFMPDRGMENASVGFDPSIEYDIYNHVDGASTKGIRNQEDVPPNTDKVLEGIEKEKKLKTPQDRLEKRKKDVIMRRVSSSKLNPPAEAQKRAEKLRTFKADLQKLKKEQEEEQIKRLEALKIERQKRIAARSGSNTAQSPLTPKQNKAPLPTKTSPASIKGSKFSDSEPRSSPSQKLPTRATSVGSNDSQRTSKLNVLSGSTNGVTRSVSSLPELKKATNGLMSEKKAASIRAKRLSDPQGSSVHAVASSKPTSSDRLPKKNMTDEPHLKISAIMQLDKTKSSTLPELKIRTPTDPDAFKISGSKKIVHREAGSEASKKSNEKSPRISNVDDNPVIEKTVVMFENDMTHAPVVQAPEEFVDGKDISFRKEKNGLDSEYVVVRAPPSSIVVNEVGYSNESKMDDNLSSPEVVIGYSKDQHQKFPDSNTMPYQAPYARVTSLEDPTTNKLGQSEQSPILNSEIPILSNEAMATAQVSNFADPSSEEPTNEMYDKPRAKESKGFRKLLKFGRKSHNPGSGEANFDSDDSAVDDSTVSSSSNDVHMLKNLISQDDVGGNPSKASRPFSLLSPFRSKTVEKKLVV